MRYAPPNSARSALMARVRQRGTSAERIVASILRSLGASYRLNVRGLPGTPDFANAKRKWAVFVNGCFWHNHSGCKAATIPKLNREFWRKKFVANRKRDARAIRTLRRSGFRVALVWQCELDAEERLRTRLSKLLEPSGINVG